MPYRTGRVGFVSSQTSRVIGRCGQLQVAGHGRPSQFIDAETRRQHAWRGPMLMHGRNLLTATAWTAGDPACIINSIGESLATLNPGLGANLGPGEPTSVCSALRRLGPCAESVVENIMCSCPLRWSILVAHDCCGVVAQRIYRERGPVLVIIMFVWLQIVRCLCLRHSAWIHVPTLR